jgi:hypothetical protein
MLNPTYRSTRYSQEKIGAITALADTDTDIELAISRANAPLPPTFFNPTYLKIFACQSDIIRTVEFDRQSLTNDRQVNRSIIVDGNMKIY